MKPHQALSKSPNRPDSRHLEHLAEIAKSTSKPLRFNRRLLNKIRLENYNRTREDFQNALNNSKVNFLKRSKSESKKLYRKRRLERLTLQDDSGQAMFDAKQNEEKKIENMTLMRKKEVVLSKMNMSKSMSSIGVNFWNNPYGKSKKSVKLMVKNS